MYSKLIHTAALALFLCLPLLTILAQPCRIQVRGQVEDVRTGLPIADANIWLEEAQVGTASDSTGRFHLTGICSGLYHLRVSHIGCETQRLFISLQKDTSLRIVLDHYSKVLESVVVKGSAGPATTQKLQSLSEQRITENARLTLANMLEAITGVSVLRSGYGIAKPVVHGLYGNRLLILNNGIPQSGQQWGNDHSPEIDPLAAQKITVTKGVGAIAHPGGALGSVIAVESGRIAREPHLHGRVAAYGESNGRGLGLHAQVQQYHQALAWRLSATLKKNGDRRSARYWLRNTGAEEANFALQLEKDFSDHWHSSLYLSTFNTELGVLRGAHIGNLTDLEEALRRKEPFFTEPRFSARIEAPRQQVSHHLLKWHNRLTLQDGRYLDFSYAGQLNNRKEFDVRRGGRSDRPALSLWQLSHWANAEYDARLGKGQHLRAGLQLLFTDNANNPETGILPLIPDYFSAQTGAFALWQKQQKRSLWELGARYDFILQNVAAISLTLPREILRYRNRFHNFGASVGWSHHLSEGFKLGWNAGGSSRNPAINELYSNGLHQGVSGIEEGDPGLKPEYSLKTTLSAEGHLRQKLFFEVLGYAQHVADYIYLAPQEEIRLTIRGAFPVFQYEQTDALILGGDVSTAWQVSEHLQVQVKYSFLYGQDVARDQPLVFMPSNNLFGAIAYEVARLGFLEHVEVALSNRYVFRQHRLLPEQDFAPPPPGYNLLGLKISARRHLSHSDWNIYLKADNVLNVAYRDYLNRQRYFADDMGRNISLGTVWVF